MTLDAYAAERSKRRCSVCVLFDARPDLKAEADAGTRPNPPLRLRPLTFPTIAGYLKLRAGDAAAQITRFSLRNHYTGHGGQG